MPGKPRPNRPYTDDGTPVKSLRGRPGKPPLTQEELARVLEIAGLGQHVKGSSMERAATEVSLMRGMHLTPDARIRKDRQVSGFWVRKQLRRLGIDPRKTVPKADEMASSIQSYTASAKHGRLNQRPMAESGSRIAPVQQQEEIPERLSDAGTQPITPKVESERNEATQ